MIDLSGDDALVLERRNEQRFEILYAMVRMSCGVNGPLALAQAQEMADVVRHQNPLSGQD